MSGVLFRGLRQIATLFPAPTIESLQNISLLLDSSGMDKSYGKVYKPIHDPHLSEQLGKKL